MTYVFAILLDLHEGARPLAPTTLARAIHRAIMHATESDIQGAEVLDARIGQTQIIPKNDPRREP